LLIRPFPNSLLKVVGQDWSFLALTELQFIYDKIVPKRLTAYKLLAHQKYRFDVFVTVVKFSTGAFLRSGKG